MKETTFQVHVFSKDKSGLWNLLNLEISLQVPMILVGNKLDLEEERAVGREQGQALARSLGPHCLFYETSAKQCIYVKEVFSTCHFLFTNFLGNAIYGSVPYFR